MIVTPPPTRTTSKISTVTTDAAQYQLQDRITAAEKLIIELVQDETKNSSGSRNRKSSSRLLPSLTKTQQHWNLDPHLVYFCGLVISVIEHSCSPPHTTNAGSVGSSSSSNDTTVIFGSKLYRQLFQKFQTFYYEETCQKQNTRMTTTTNSNNNNNKKLKLWQYLTPSMIPSPQVQQSINRSISSKVKQQQQCHSVHVETQQQQEKVKLSQTLTLSLSSSSKKFKMMKKKKKIKNPNDIKTYDAGCQEEEEDYSNHEDIDFIGTPQQQHQQQKKTRMLNLQMMDIMDERSTSTTSSCSSHRESSTSSTTSSRKEASISIFSLSKCSKFPSLPPRHYKNRYERNSNNEEEEEEDEEEKYPSWNHQLLKSPSQQTKSSPQKNELLSETKNQCSKPSSSSSSFSFTKEIDTSVPDTMKTMSTTTTSTDYHPVLSPPHPASTSKVVLPILPSKPKELQQQQQQQLINAEIDNNESIPEMMMMLSSDHLSPEQQTNDNDNGDDNQIPDPDVISKNNTPLTVSLTNSSAHKSNNNNNSNNKICMDHRGSMVSSTVLVSETKEVMTMIPDNVTLPTLISSSDSSDDDSYGPHAINLDRLEGDNNITWNHFILLAIFAGISTSNYWTKMKQQQHQQQQASQCRSYGEDTPGIQQPVLRISAHQTYADKQDKDTNAVEEDNHTQKIESLPPPPKAVREKGHDIATISHHDEDPIPSLSYEQHDSLQKQDIPSNETTSPNIVLPAELVPETMGIGHLDSFGGFLSHDDPGGTGSDLDPMENQIQSNTVKELPQEEGEILPINQRISESAQLVKATEYVAKDELPSKHDGFKDIGIINELGPVAEELLAGIHCVSQKAEVDEEDAEAEEEEAILKKDQNASCIATSPEVASHRTFRSLRERVYKLELALLEKDRRMLKMRCERDEALESAQAMESKAILNETRTRTLQNHLAAQVSAVREMVMEESGSGASGGEEGGHFE